MKAITIRQPWAEAIARGAKTVENRGRLTAYRGPIAIHAGKLFDDWAVDDPRLQEMFRQAHVESVGAWVGVVVAVADLVDCHVAEDRGQRETCCAPWGDRWYAGKAGVDIARHLVLANIRRLPTPVPATGEVRVGWDLPDAVAAEVEAQLAEAVAR